MKVTLPTFPAPLLHLVLCGGLGLPPAWGPLDGSDHGGSCEHSVWHARRRVAYTSRGVAYQLLNDEVDDLFAGVDEGWLFPLDEASPWIARMAAVAQGLLGDAGIASVIGDTGTFITLTMVTERLEIIQKAWHRATGRIYSGSVPAPDLPTLPQHLAALPELPASVALLLSIYDVPQIRARVDEEVIRDSML